MVRGVRLLPLRCVWVHTFLMLIMTLWRTLFDETDEEEEACDAVDLSPVHQHELQHQVLPSPQVPGLVLVPGFLTAAEQEYFRSRVESELVAAGGGAANQAMRFGDLPAWAMDLGDRVSSVSKLHGLLPQQVLSREPCFDQLILNLYRPGEGITAHVDLLRFEDGICSISFGDPAVMTFSKVRTEARRDGGTLDDVQVLLRGGDLLLMHGEARYNWKHGLAAVTQELYNGQLPPWTEVQGVQGPSLVAASRAHPVVGPTAVGERSLQASGSGLDASAEPAAAPGAGSATVVTGLMAPGSDSGQSPAEAGANARRRVVPLAAVRTDSSPCQEEGVLVVRGTRLSVTLRKLCTDIVLCEHA